ncbi:MAG: hypothetical protein ACYC8W_05480 [Candidatus Tyrphobacter sp.]
MMELLEPPEPVKPGIMIVVPAIALAANESITASSLRQDPGVPDNCNCESREARIHCKHQAISGAGSCALGAGER